MYSLGCRPSPYDERDRRYSELYCAETFPPEHSLMQFMPPVWNQGSRSSCTGYAIKSAVETELIKEGLSIYEPSALFIYYNERSMEGTITSDAGANLRDGMKSVANLGVCDVRHWPDDPDRWEQKPGTVAYLQARSMHHRSREYRRLQSLEDIKHALLQDNPVVMGAQVYSGLFTTTDVMPMPRPGERPAGGHALKIMAYSDVRQCMQVKNSWGHYWGQGGYCWIPYEFIQSRNVYDLWELRSV